MGFREEVQEFYQKGVVREHKRLVRKIANTAFTKMVFRTPVDTGRARASWTINEDRPDERVAAEGALNYAPAVNNLGPLKDFPVVYITNGVPYIERLENGWSPQAPPGGIVALTIAELETFAGVG